MKIIFCNYCDKVAKSLEVHLLFKDQFIILVRAMGRNYHFCVFSCTSFIEKTALHSSTNPTTYMKRYSEKQSEDKFKFYRVVGEIYKKQRSFLSMFKHQVIFREMYFFKVVCNKTKMTKLRKFCV